MKDILRIGEFSKLNNIPIRTLRFYDQIGLLKPYQVDPETNYRGYHIEQSSLVDAIQYLRQLDFSLEEIKEILSDIENSHLHKLIIDKYQQLIEEQKRIKKQLREIEIYQSGALLYQTKSTLNTWKSKHFLNVLFIAFRLIQISIRCQLRNTNFIYDVLSKKSYNTILFQSF